MSFTAQIKSLLVRRAVSTTELGAIVGIARLNLAATLAGKRDTRGSTLEALATGLDAEWVACAQRASDDGPAGAGGEGRWS
jgi:DNA-binding Xre family transcriptional regulator